MNDQEAREALREIARQCAGPEDGVEMPECNRCGECFSVDDEKENDGLCHGCAHDICSELPGLLDHLASRLAPSGTGEVERTREPFRTSTPAVWVVEIRSPHELSWCLGGVFFSEEKASRFLPEVVNRRHRKYIPESDRAAVSQAAELRGARKVLEEIREEADKLAANLGRGYIRSDTIGAAFEWAEAKYGKEPA